MALVIKNLPANAGDIMLGSIPELGRSPGGGHGNPLWYSCLENPIDRGAWWSTVHRVVKSWTLTEVTPAHPHTHDNILLHNSVRETDSQIPLTFPT